MPIYIFQKLKMMKVKILKLAMKSYLKILKD